MGKSIMQDKQECYFCGATDHLEKHHVFAGVANRRISEQYGLTVWLCHDHHTGKHGAQYDKDLNLKLKQDAQKAFEMYYSRALWMMKIGKNYLG